MSVKRRSYSLDSLKGPYMRIRSIIGVIKGDTWSLEYSSYVYF